MLSEGNSAVRGGLDAQFRHPPGREGLSHLYLIPGLGDDHELEDDIDFLGAEGSVLENEVEFLDFAERYGKAVFPPGFFEAHFARSAVKDNPVFVAKARAEQANPTGEKTQAEKSRDDGLSEPLSANDQRKGDASHNQSEKRQKNPRSHRPDLSGPKHQLVRRFFLNLIER